jgi:hypothetical protein
MDDPHASARERSAVAVSFPALRHGGFRTYFFASALAMMADSIEHVVSYWVMFQKFESPTLAGLPQEST